MFSDGMSEWYRAEQIVRHLKFSHPNNTLTEDTEDLIRIIALRLPSQLELLERKNS